MADEIKVDIEKTANQPKSVMVDGERVEQHSLPDQIAADKYLRQIAARKKRRLPIQIVALRHPGAVL